MPNGADKNFIRLCAALDGFRARYGEWPVRVVIPAESLADLRDHILTPQAFESIVRKVALVAGASAFRAEDDTGRSYEYGKEGFPTVREGPRAIDWLGVH
jgi:hypothetical protein